MSGRALARCLVAILAVTGIARAQEGQEDRWDLLGGGPGFSDDFVRRGKQPSRWIGRDYLANRLMDWRLGPDGLECVESSRAKPMRTAMLLSAEVGSGDGRLGFRLRLGAADGEGEPEDRWQGLLLGVGGPHVNWKTSALVHHWPGIDGGLVLAVDGKGRLALRDNGHRDGPRGPRRDLTSGAWPVLESGQAPDGFDPAREAVLVGFLIAEEGVLTLRAQLLQGGRFVQEGGAMVERGVRTVSRLEATLAPEDFEGRMGLVSHRTRARFQSWQVRGDLLVEHPERTFGPVVGVLYTIEADRLNLTAQLVPMSDTRVPKITLEVGTDRRTELTVDTTSWTARGTLDEVLTGEDRHYTIKLRPTTPDGPHMSRIVAEGTIRQPPGLDEELVVGALSCQDISSAGQKHWNNDHFWWPHTELVDHLRSHEPDLLFFAGDQIYEGGLEGIVRRPTDKAILDYLNHWYRFLWAFGDLTRSRPTICLPDDHDVYHGNIWGNGGVRAPAWEGIQYDSDRGGYMMPPEFVNVVHDTQVSHLPAPRDPEPLPNGISVYHTSLEYGGVSFGIVADRMWKSAPAPLLPGADVRNGWARAEDFDATQDADAEGALLLGPRQLGFLEDWVAEWGEDTRMKVLLSQTIFNNVATLPPGANSGNALPGAAYPGPGEYPEGEQVAADFDSNAWPQSGRRRALEILRRGLAFHVAGDQHLASFVQYGLDDHGDGPFAFCVPAIANLWPRRFFPPTPGDNRPEGAPPYVGDHRDGFGNPMTVHAVANPVRSGVPPTALNDRNPGYGIVRFDPAAGTITSECWPRWVDPGGTDPRQFEGWPRTVEIEDGYLRRSDHWLPKLRFEGVDDPLLTVIARDREQVVYRVRARGPEHVLRVPGEGPYEVLVSDPDSGRSRRVTGLRPARGGPEGEIRINLADPTPGAPAD